MLGSVFDTPSRVGLFVTRDVLFDERKLRDKLRSMFTWAQNAPGIHASRVISGLQDIDFARTLPLGVTAAYGEPSEHSGYMQDFRALLEVPRIT